MDNFAIELTNRIQSVTNFSETLDRLAIDTVYGVLFVDKNNESRPLWTRLQAEIEELRKLSVSIRAAANNP